jgi:metallophosphoesterase (TIGR00282 family)
MKVLFIGDIVGRPGRKTVKKVLPEIKDEHSPDLIIANGENLAHGRGITEDNIKEMQEAGIDYFTSGNHVYDNKAVADKLNDKNFPVIRPINFPPNNPGRGYHIFETAKLQKIAIINLHGRVFINHNYDCPFRKFDEILPEIKAEQPQAIIVDFHAEATSEKVAFGHYVDGRASAVLGTHTHVPTSDGKILKEGTAYISDVGMVGTSDSVIGAKKEDIIEGFLNQMPFRYDIPDGDTEFAAVLIEIDDNTGKATQITQILKNLTNT